MSMEPKPLAATPEGPRKVTHYMADAMRGEAGCDYYEDGRHTYRLTTAYRREPQPGDVGIMCACGHPNDGRAADRTCWQPSCTCRDRVDHLASIDAACEVMHDAYERAAVGAGWETNPVSRVAWAEVPPANQATMRAAVQALLEWVSNR